MSFLLIHIEGCALGEGDAVSCVQIVKTHLAQTDAQPHRHDGSQQFAMLARIERVGIVGRAATLSDLFWGTF